MPLPGAPEGAGSIIVLVATDAPLLPHQCEPLARRAALGIGRTGGVGEDSSGDLLLAFATGNRGVGTTEPTTVELLPNARMNDLFVGAVEATEEAVLNTLWAAPDVEGREGRVQRGLPHGEALGLLRARGVL